MNIFARIWRVFRAQQISRVDMVTQCGNSFFAWNGSVYRSDIVRACVAPRANAMSKLVAKHIRESISKDGEKTIAVNPDPGLRSILSEPNPYMSWDRMMDQMGNQLAINSNAFALIVRDPTLGYVTQIYPINCADAEAVYQPDGTLFLRFDMPNGKRFTFPYLDIIHIREDYNDNDIFGTPKMEALSPLLDIVTTTDQGIVNAIKNSSVIRWLLKFTSSMRDEDVKKATDNFASQFLAVSNGTGVAGVDAKAEAQQITPNDYVPNASQMDRTTSRIYAIFNTNPKIVNSSASDEEWNTYYEMQIEPVAICLKNEFTRKLFTPRERACGNYIAFEASNLSCASIQVKLALVAMVDRGALTPNEWRATMNLAPIVGGDKPLRRLDTEAITAVIDKRLMDIGLMKGGKTE